MKFINSIEEISNHYNYFIFDVWGVVHDGTTAYPGAIEAITYLRNQGKKICFLSNAPRRASKVAAMLEKFGVTSNLYDFIMSSGEAAFRDLQKNQEADFKDFGKNYFYIGPKKDIDLLDGLNYTRVDDAAQAHFAITTGFDGDNSVLAEKMPQALAAKANNLTLICVNPDMIVVKQDGREMICAGALAKEYKALGGKVVYYGKPFSSVYKIVCEIFNDPKNDEMLMIGDGMETDIKGANDFKIDSLLITGGILSNILGINYRQNADHTKLENFCKQHQLFPNFVISSLKI
ncbi:MAG: TIGR01459 family HAD-type hydrolase [Rickettsiales bacterium]|nr:TIGR01459 family HAD-type hydrolase [Rickettsiales bacterium]